jgi:hypothetical protein
MTQLTRKDSKDHSRKKMVLWDIMRFVGIFFKITFMINS